MTKRRTPAANPSPAAPPRSYLREVSERLSRLGYVIHRTAWSRFAGAGLLPVDVTTENAIPRAVNRARGLLDVQAKLAPSAGDDALAYFMAAAGAEGVPHEAIVRHVSSSIAALFAFGDRVREEIRWEQRFVGPDGEWRLGRFLAKALLRSYVVENKADYPVLESLLAAAFVAYVRSTFENPRPDRVLHQSSTLVNLSAEAEEEEGMPRRKRAAAPPLLPVADRDGLIAWVSELSDAQPLVDAVRGSAALVRLHAPRFPILGSPWSDASRRCGPTGAHALHALCFVPPVLAAAYLQAGRAPSDARLEPALETLMHQWGTVRRPAIRFGLAEPVFPWVDRSVANPKVQIGQ
jgi:hypothetical protein